ncbi:MAG: hypothetical protein HONBIEJF_02121 [Fimbriimonadaceae bacterium]|nr:hypothetical protein [Fimbriimonadaceae bacterium]
MSPSLSARIPAGNFLVAVTLLASPCAAQVQNVDPFKASSVIKRFTGQNGFEELMVACERAADSSLARLRKVAFTVGPETTSGGQSAETTAERRAVGISEGMTLLEVRELVVARHRDCLELLRRGAAKPTFDPRLDSLDFNTEFGDFSLLRDLARISLMAAAVESAHGRQRQAVDQIVLALVVGDSIRKTAMIGQLVANAIYQQAFAEIEKRQAGFGLGEWQRMQEWAQAKIASNDEIMEVLKTEFGVLERHMFDPNESAKDFLRKIYDGGLDESSEPPEFVKSLSESAAATVRANARRRLQEAAREWVDHLSGDEASWLKNMPQPRGLNIEADKVKTRQELEEVVLATMQPVHEQILISHARMRTQVRLLSLNAKIQRFRLHHDKLPAALAGVAEEEELDDPHSGAPFVYELREDGTFRLYSKGFRNTGEIEFRYRRPKGAPARENEPPHSRD